MKPKEPLLAVLVTMVFPGLGHVYAGKIKKGLSFALIYLGMMAIALLLVSYVIQPQTNITTSLLTFFIILCVFGFIFQIAILVDAYQTTKQFNQAQSLDRNISWLKRVFFIIGIIFVFLYPPVNLLLGGYTNYIRENFVQAFKMPAGSMSPTLEIGDRILADKMMYKRSKPQRGDLIVFKYPPDPKRDFVKRIIAFEGETVEIKDGKIFINGQLFDSSAIKSIYYYNRGEYGQAGKPVTVPEGHYYVLGDNSSSSHDSRYWGFVPQESLLGKIYKIYWPINRAGLIK